MEKGDGAEVEYLFSFQNRIRFKERFVCQSSVLTRGRMAELYRGIHTA